MSVFASRPHPVGGVCRIVVANTPPVDIEYRIAEFEDLLSFDPEDYALDELCQIHSRLLELVSYAFHDGNNAQGGYITLLCDKIMAEIKNQLLYMAI